MATMVHGNTSYTVSLDTDDISYFLRRIHEPTNGLIKPLWSNTGRKHNDYYEFKVITDDNNDVGSEVIVDQDIICEAYMCHICNIHVPKIYMKEHNESIKHKTCLEIADKSLERAKKQINEEFNHNDSLIRYDCYFCSSCSAAVASELKGDHEKTQAHMISVKHDELLGEFLKYYSDKNNVKIDFELDKTKLVKNLDEINNTDSDTNETKKVKNEAIDVVSKPSTSKVEINNDAAVNNTNDVINKSSRYKKVRSILNKKSKASLDTTENKTDKFENVSSNLETTITESSSTNAKSKVDLDSSGKTFQVCSNLKTTVKIKDLDSPNKAPIKVNGNTTNKLNEAELNLKTDTLELNSTAIANTKVDIETNIETESSPSKKKKKIRIRDLNRYYLHISTGHKVTLNTKDILELNVNDEFFRVSTNNFHSYKQVEGRKQCQLCNLDIHDEMESHMFTEHHKVLVMVPILGNECIRQLSLNDFHCILCNEKIHNIKKHIDSKIHCENLNQAVVIKETLVESDIVTIIYQNSGMSHCEICEMDISSSNFAKHTNTKNHQQNYERKYPTLSPNKEKHLGNNKFPKVPTVSTQTIKICKICKIEVPVNDMEEHLQGKIHGLKYNSFIDDNKLEQIPEGHNCVPCKTTVAVGELMNHVVTQEHMSNLSDFKFFKNHDVFRPFTLNKNYIYCLICEKMVIKDTLSIEEHLDSNSHVNKLNVFLNNNTIKKTVERDIYHCSVCDEVINKFKMEHINNDKHKNALNEFNILKSIIIHPHMERTDNDKELKCKLCLVTVILSTNDIDTHLKGKKHIKKYNKILESFKIIDDKYFCEKCNRIIETGKELDHIHQEDDGSTTPESNSESSDVKDNLNEPLGDEYISKIISTYLGSFDSIKIADHSKIDSNSKVINLEEPSTSKIQVPETSKSEFLHQDMEEKDNPGTLHCRVCKVMVPKNDHCIDLHVKGTKHNNKYKLLLSENKLKENDDCFHCEFCGYTLNKNQVFDHIDNDMHEWLKTLRRSLDVHYLIDMKETGMECKICKIKIINEPDPIKKHLASPTHVAGYDSFIKENIFEIRNEVHHCKCCNEILEINEEYDHSLSEEHRNNLIEYKSNPTKYVCKKCNVSVPNNKKNINEHLKGATHQSNVMLISVRKNISSNK